MSPENTQCIKTSEVLTLLRGSGQPTALVGLAVLVASSSEEIRTILGWMFGRSSPQAKLPPTPPLHEWMPMYRSHRRMANALLSGLGEDGEHEATEFMDEVAQMQRLTPDEIRAEVEKMSREEQEVFIMPFLGVPFPPDDDTLRLMLAEEDKESESEPECFDALLSSVEGQYFFRVWLPCWIVYRELPPMLLRRARRGETDALDKILRLDKSLLSDPAIAHQVHEVTHNGSKRDRDLILNAISGLPKGSLDPKTIKYGLAGMISQMAKTFQCRVTAPEIAQLFDGIERVRTGRASDRHIPAGEAFTKAIQRNRNWPGADLTKPDK